MFGTKSLLFAFLRFSLLTAAWRSAHQRDRLTLLCFHDPQPGVFHAHLQALKRHYTLISLSHAVEWMRGQRPSLPPFPLVVTLDDGHAGNIQLVELLAQ